MTTVITYGTFDLFHIGHVNLFRRLKSLGDRLVVGVSTDEFNSVKGKKTIFPFEHRSEIVSTCRYVDAVFPELTWDQKRDDIKREKASLLGMGNDWVGRFDDLSDVCQVVYLPRTQDISTTEVRQLVNALHQERISELKAATEKVLRLVASL
jgi:glycerol-3-phosphate cytidylyltransferase